MNVITAYLETMFGAHPPTPRMLEAKAELHAMMEDAYHGYLAEGLTENEAVGRVITEFGNLDELAPQLGISAEIAPAPAAAVADTNVGGTRRSVAPAPAPVTLDEAQAFAEARRTGEPRLALAVAMFVLSPAPLIALTTLGSGGVIALDEQVGVMIGLGILLVAVAVAVMMVVRRGQQLAPFTRLLEGDFTRTPAVDRWARQLAAEAAPKRTTALQVSIGLWILAVTPVLAVSLLAPPSVSSSWIGVAVAAMLAIVATGLLIFLPSNWATSVAETLTQAEGAGVASDDRRGIVGVVSAFYWPLVVVAFLGWSFIGGDWGRSWIIWPIAAVFFAAISSGLHAVERYRSNRAGQPG